MFITCLKCIFLLLFLLIDGNSSTRVSVYAEKGWYSNQAEVLKQQITHNLNQDSEVLCIVSPHAGFKYSLKVAMKAFDKVESTKFKRVVILGPSHYKSSNKAILSNFRDFQTPAGLVSQDIILVKELLKAPRYFTLDNETHQKEHSIELQIPLIKSYLPDVSIVAILIPDQPFDTLKHYAKLIKSKLSKEDLLVISTDMSHYPRLQMAKKIDQRSFEVVRSSDAMSLLNYEHKIRKSGLAACSFCGIAPLVVSKLIYPPATYTFEGVSYDTSYTASNNKDRVVGYGSFTVKKKLNSNTEFQSELLQISKLTLQNVYSKLKKRPAISFKNMKELKQSGQGAFVTLTNNHQLRGCIGLFESDMNLANLISYLTVQASKDSRFISNPITLGELSKFKIEVSLLSPLQPIKSYQNIVLGKHGIVIEKEGKRAVFLPQVASENNWNLIQFWENLSQRKLGESRDSYLSKNAKLFRFSTQVFSKRFID